MLYFHTKDAVFSVGYTGHADMRYSVFLSQGGVGNNAICGINVRNRACKKYKVNPCQSGLHSDLTRPSAS